MGGDRAGGARIVVLARYKVPAGMPEFFELTGSRPNSRVRGLSTPCHQSINSRVPPRFILAGIPHMEPSQPVECDSKPHDVQFAFE